MVTDVKQNMENTVREAPPYSPGACADSDKKWQQTGIRIKVVEELRRLAEEHELTKVVLFGSRARGDFRRENAVQHGWNLQNYAQNPRQTAASKTIELPIGANISYLWLSEERKYSLKICSL